MTTADKRALIALVNVLVEAAREAYLDGQEGAPLSPIFMAFAEVGISYNEFMGMVDIAVASGRIKRVDAGTIAYVEQTAKQ